MRGKQMLGYLIGIMMSIIMVTCFVKFMYKMLKDQLKHEYNKMEEIRRKKEQGILSENEELPVCKNDIFGA